MNSTTHERIRALATRAKTNEPLVMLTAYDYATARIVDAAGVDLVLVGDSAATTVLGYESTREIRSDELLMLTRAVRRGVQSALLVGDLPFGTYEDSDELAVATAAQFIDAGCDAVKLEGAGARLSRVSAILEAGFAVIGHVGLLPQDYTSFAGLRARGRSADDALEVVRDAITLAKAGCCAIVVEAVPEVVAREVAARVSVPVIGIGAGALVDGQVLVLHDLLGLGEGRTPRFVRRYAQLREHAIHAIQHFARDVRARDYPGVAESYSMPAAEQERFVNESVVSLGDQNRP